MEPADVQDQLIIGSSSSYGASHLQSTKGFNESILNPTQERQLHKVESSSYCNIAMAAATQFSAQDLQLSNHYYTHQLLRHHSQSNDVMNKTQIFPSINISTLNQQGVTNAAYLDMLNSHFLHLLTSSRFSQNQIGLYYNSTIDRMQPLYTSNKISETSSNGAKRSCSEMEYNAVQTATKKSRASYQPFKVRKEKLGDRIAALQQLVAPFGKTDTASVLMEAIGYIKFLQSQVETLSVPYMKTSLSKTPRAMKADPIENGGEEPKRDLKTRGLCLVPLACMSFITHGGGGGEGCRGGAVFWPPPHFGGAA